MTDEISDLRLFARLVAAGNLSAAARQLNASPAAMSRRLARLEERLGVRLVARNSRRFELTEEGSLLHERCLRILADIDEAEAEAAAKGQALQGLIRVGAPSELGRRRIAPLIGEFTTRHPRVQVQLALSDAALDVMESGLDVLLRLGRPAETDAIATRLVTSRRVVVAAPAYIEHNGLPASPDDLRRHDCIRLVRGRWVFDQWLFRDGAGEQRPVKVDGPLSTTSGEVVHDWALAGRGIALKALWDVRDDLAAGRLVECLADHWCDEIELYAVYPGRRLLPPRVRAFLDFIRAALA